MDFEALFEAGLSALPFCMSPENREAIRRYLTLLGRWNAVHNLTAVRDPCEQLRRHIFDCLALVPLVPQDARRLADIGSGPGLPGLLLALARPQMAVTLVEVSQKKAAFLRQARCEMGLANVEVAQERVEHLNLPPFDVLVSRAMSAPQKLIALTEALSHPQTQWLLMQGRETSAPPPGYGAETIALTVPFLAESRQVLRVVKL